MKLSMKLTDAAWVTIFLLTFSGNRAGLPRESGERLNHFLLFAALLLATLLAACGKPDSTPGVSDPAPSAAGGGQPMTREVYSLDWLVKNSPFVFVARLSAMDVERESRGLVVTRNRFEVENTLIGASPQKVVTLTTLGGTMGNETVSVSHTPEFVKGQTYVIFTDLARTTYNPITGDERGVFLVVNSEIFTYDGRAITGIEDGKFRFSSMMLDKYPGAPSREPEPARATDPTVGGGVISAQTTVAPVARPMQLTEFSELVMVKKR